MANTWLVPRSDGKFRDTKTRLEFLGFTIERRVGYCYEVTPPNGWTKTQISDFQEAILNEQGETMLIQLLKTTRIGTIKAPEWLHFKKQVDVP